MREITYARVSVVFLTLPSPRPTCAAQIFNFYFFYPIFYSSTRSRAARASRQILIARARVSPVSLYFLHLLFVRTYIYFFLFRTQASACMFSPGRRCFRCLGALYTHLFPSFHDFFPISPSSKFFFVHPYSCSFSRAIIRRSSFFRRGARRIRTGVQKRAGV